MPYEDDDILTVDPMEVEAIVEPTTPVKPKKKTPSVPKVATPKVEPPAFLFKREPIGRRVKEPELLLEKQKPLTPLEAAKKLLTTGRVTEEEKETLTRPSKLRLRPAPLPVPTLAEKFAEPVKGFARSIGTMATELPRGAGATLDLLNTINPFVAEEDVGLLEERLKPISERATSAIETALPPDPRLGETEAFILQDIPGALGSAAGFLATGAAGRAVKVPSLLSSAGLGGVINVAGVAREADAMGIDPSRRKAALAAALATGITEAAGLGRAIEKFGLKQTFTRRLLDITEEFGQEGLQQWLNNLNAVVIGGYDQDRDQFEGVLKGAILGGITGGVVTGYDAFSQKRARVQEQREADRRYGVSDISQIKVVPGSKPVPTPTQVVPPSGVLAAALPISPRIQSEIKRAQVSVDNLTRGIERARNLGNEERVKVREAELTKLQTKLTELKDVAESDMAYDILPPLREGQSPVLVVPSWVLAAAENDTTTNSAGKTIFPGKPLEEARQSILDNAPSPDHAEGAVQAFDEIVRLSQQGGFPSVALVNRDALALDKFTQVHESIHMGQIKAAEQIDPGNYLELHDPRWAASHPAIQRIIQERIATDVVGEYQDEADVLATEIPAYVMSGDSDMFFKNSADGIDFVLDYFSHILDYRGPEALGTIETAARIPSERQDVIPLVRSTYETWVREQVDTGTLTTEQGRRLIESLTPSSSTEAVARIRDVEGRRDVEYPGAGREARIGSETGDTTISGAISGVTPEQRSANLIKFREGSQVEEPVYHGTTGDFDVFAKSNDLGYHFGTPNAAATRATTFVQEEDYDPTKGTIGFRLEPLPNASIGSFWLSLKNPLHVPDIFKSDNIQQTVKGLVDLGHIEQNQLLDSKLTALNRATSTIKRQTVLSGDVSSATETANKLKKGIQEEVYRQLEAKGYDGFVYSNKFEDPGSISYVVFRPEQIKSAIGNKGTFDPKSPSFLQAQMPTPPSPPPSDVTVGDRVKVKGYASEADVVELIDDEWAKVKFPDGTEDEFLIANLYKTEKKPVPPPKMGTTSKIAQQVSPAPAPVRKGVVPTLPGPMRIKKTRLWVNRIGPGDTPGTVKVEFGDGTLSQFDLDEVRDASGKKVKDPMVYMLVEEPPTSSIPPPTRPPTPDLPPGGPYPSLFTPQIGVTYSQVMSKKFIDLLNNNNIRYDFAKPPSLQVYEALVEEKLRDQDVEVVLTEEGMTWEDFADSIYGTYSAAGATLQTLSEIVQRHWVRLRRDNPDLFKKLLPPSKQIDLILEDLNETILGMSLWKRAGRVFQKAALTQYATAATNLITSVGRVPIDATAAGLGRTVQGMVEGKSKPWANRMADAREAGYDTLMSGFEAWRALNPTQLQEVVTGKVGREYAQYQEVISEIETYFPDLHSKLFAKPLELEAKELTDAEEKLKLMMDILPAVGSKDKRQEQLKEIKKLEKAIKREKSLLVKAGFGAPEVVYDTFLRPMQFGEFLMRRPRFVARLGLELKDRGIDMTQVLKNSHLTEDQLMALPQEERVTFKTIPPEAVKAALNDALEFTMALDPTVGPDSRSLEKVAYYFIRMMNQMGPISVLTDVMYPKAIYSAAKTFYDYSSLPFMFEWAQEGSFRRIANQMFGTGLAKDPKTGEKYLNYPPSRGDYERLGRAMTGTFMYTLALSLIKFGLIGDEWYQLKTGTKGEDGNPVYVDMRKWIPFSRIFQLTHLVDRYANGRATDTRLGVEMLDILLGMKKYGGDQDIVDVLDATAEYWSGPERNPFKTDKVLQMVPGKHMAILLTPFLNLRSIVATYDEDENVRKDYRGYGFWGPSLDRLPWFRRQLPDLTYPTYEGRMELSESPALQQLTGIQLSESPSFMGREFQRLGINIREYLPKDPDPLIDQRQNEIFSYLADYVGSVLENDPEYKVAPDEMKAAMWEGKIMGHKGIAAKAIRQGLKANPMEAKRRMMTAENPGRFIRGMTGLAEILESMKN